MAEVQKTDPVSTEMARIIVERHLVPRDRYICGFADLSGAIDPRYGEFRYAITIGKKLDYTILDSIAEGPTAEYYDHYKQTNRDLAVLSKNIARELEEAGISTICIDPSISTDKLDSDYSHTLRTDFSHKMAATRAGLGWIGKTALLITKEFGPRLRLVTILTDTPLKDRKDPLERSRCGKCNSCVEACPAGAATGQLWEVSMDRDDFFDAHKCRSQCQVFGERLPGGDARICGICVSVCPIGIKNRKAQSVS